MADPMGKSRGYGFVEFATEEDLKNAYRRADGLRIDGRRVLVDVERGRTVSGAYFSLTIALSPQLAD